MRADGGGGGLWVVWSVELLVVLSVVAEVVTQGPGTKAGVLRGARYWCRTAWFSCQLEQDHAGRHSSHQFTSPIFMF